MDARLPAPLRPGDTIAVTAPSSGVPPTLQPRLDLAIAGLRRRGFEVVEGVCLRDVAPTHVSASREARADELMALLVDPDVHAVIVTGAVRVNPPTNMVIAIAAIATRPSTRPRPASFLTPLRSPMPSPIPTG